MCASVTRYLTAKSTNLKPHLTYLNEKDFFISKTKILLETQIKMLISNKYIKDSHAHIHFIIFIFVISFKQQQKGYKKCSDRGMEVYLTSKPWETMTDIPIKRPKYGQPGSQGSYTCNK